MIREQKAALRAELRALRAALSEDERAKRDTSICRSLLPLLDGVKLLLLFYPKGAEIDLRPVFHAARARGIPCAFPRCGKEKGEMEFYLVSDLEELEEGKFRVLCSTALERAFETFDIRAEVDENTVGGWVSSELDKIPEEGDSFSYMNLDVVVTKTDSRRVVEIEVTVVPPEVMEEREKEREAEEQEKASETKAEDPTEEKDEAYMD